MTRLVPTALLVCALVSSTRAMPQQRDSLAVSFGHAYMGSDRFDLTDSLLVVSSKNALGNGRVRIVTEFLSPSPSDWRDFWSRVDSIGAWRWKPAYSDSATASLMDGSALNITLAHGGRRVTTRAYNAEPPALALFNVALQRLLSDARRGGRDWEPEELSITETRAGRVISTLVWSPSRVTQTDTVDATHRQPARPPHSDAARLELRMTAPMSARFAQPGEPAWRAFWRLADSLQIWKWRTEYRGVGQASAGATGLVVTLRHGIGVTTYALDTTPPHYSELRETLEAFFPR